MVGLAGPHLNLQGCEALSYPNSNLAAPWPTRCRGQASAWQCVCCEVCLS